VILRTDLMKEVVGKNIHQATRTSSVSWSRLFGVPKVLLPLWSPIGVVVVLNFQLSFFEEELSPAPKGSDTDGTVSVIWGAMYVQQGVFLLCIQLSHAVRLPSRRWKIFCEK
jgi:hypothetical protein